MTLTPEQIATEIRELLRPKAWAKTFDQRQREFHDLADRIWLPEPCTIDEAGWEVQWFVHGAVAVSPGKAVENQWHHPEGVWLFGVLHPWPERLAEPRTVTLPDHYEAGEWEYAPPGDPAAGIIGIKRKKSS